MKILFVHQNMPGQYRELIQVLAAQKAHELVFLTQRNPAPKIEGVATVVYKSHHVAQNDAYALSRVWEDAAGAGYGATRAMKTYEEKTGFKPDLILGHTGWGELTFFKQLWPDVPILGFFEYFYQMEGGLVGFDPNDPPSEAAPYTNQARNVVPYMNLDSVDLGLVPTRWQHDRFPPIFHDKFYICHDGIRTDRLGPDPDVTLNLGRVDRPITRDDEIITYMARNMEHARGFHIFMRALPKILKARPNVRVLAIGGNDVSYGPKSKHPRGLRGEMEDELGHLVDWDRVHFLGRVPYDMYTKVVQISRCHMALTMPFVMSWSLLETMAMEATVVSTDVASVREAITHGETGLLVDFFDPDALAAQVIDVLENPGEYAHIGPAARKHVVENYDFLTRCLPEHVEKMNSLVADPAKHIKLA
jgi:glycosyltransferase involved in cell wall biosynthesis